MFVRSPLSYQGNKYKLLKQLVANLPSDRHTLIDVFGGSGTVALNLLPYFKRVIYNEYDRRVFEVLREFKYAKSPQHLIRKIDRIISKWQLGSCEEAYYEFREHVREKQEPLLNMLCSKYAHSSLFRFNKQGQFNAPLAKDGRNYGASASRNKQIKEVWERLQCITLWNRPYSEVVTDSSPDKLFTQQVLCYCDPPYLASGANIYTHKWSEELEVDFLNYLYNLDAMSFDIMLSNVLRHRHHVNKILIKWLKVQNFNVHSVEYNGELYRITNSQGKPTSDHNTVEIIGCNYEVCKTGINR